MFCKKCGTQNLDEARFCKKCGEPLSCVINTNTLVNGEKTDAKKNRKSVYYIVGALVIVIALIIAIILGMRGKKAKEYEQYIASAEKYIEELDFEQAKDYYLQAIHIAPKELEPYVRLAQIYVDEGDATKAEAILKDAVDKGAKGTQEIEEEAEEVRSAIKELKNGISYDWVVEPTIEADDIYYVKYESENLEDPTNIMKRQTIEPYAVIEKDDALGLIDMDGEMILGMKYKNVQQYYGQYLLKSIEPEYHPDFQMEWDMFSWDETYGMTIADGFGGASPGVFYYCDGLYNIEEDNEMFDVYVPEEAMPVLLTEEVYGGYDSTGLWAYEWLERQEEKYGVYYQGKLVVEDAYDEYGSESDGLLAVCKDGKWGYINQNGDVVIPLEYDASWDKYNVGSDLGTSTYVEFCYAASDGYVVLRKGDQWELRDVTGKIAIPAGEFEAIRPVYEGKCWVKQDGKWGVIELVEKKEEKSEELNESQLEMIDKFLENEIYTKYVIPDEEVESTYYCQTYGRQAGIGYSTKVTNNFYDNVGDWLLASNIYDYNGDDIQDLFLVMIQDKGNDRMGKIDIDYMLYTFDEAGNANFAGKHTQDLEAGNFERTFAFVDDKLIEFNHYDYSMDSEGEDENRINYAVTDDIRWHTASLSVLGFDSELGEIETIFDFARFNHPGDVVTFSEGFDYFETETDVVNEVYTQLNRLGINGIEIPLSNSWENRWNDVFYISDDSKSHVTKLTAEATLSEEDFAMGEIESQSDGSVALRTSTGKIKFAINY